LFDTWLSLSFFFFLFLAVRFFSCPAHSLLFFFN
jgi:hypothetical protein